MKWSTWAYIVRKKEYEFSFSMHSNVYYYQEFQLPSDFILVFCARYQNNCVYPEILREETNQCIKSQYGVVYAEQDVTVPIKKTRF